MLPILFNPESGSKNGEKVALQLKSFLESGQIQGKLYPTRDVQDLQSLSENIDLPQGVLACVGGDGTLHQCVQGLMRRREPAKLLPVPAGTGNAFMKHFQIENLESLLDRMNLENELGIDLLEVQTNRQTHYCFNIVGLGMFARGNEKAEKLRYLGKARYDLAGLWELLQKKLDSIDASLKQSKISQELHFLVIMNTSFTGADMFIAPMADPQDGKFDLLALPKTSRSNLFSLFKALPTARHLKDDKLIVCKDSKIEFHKEVGPLNLDGELVFEKVQHVKVRQGALLLAINQT